MGGEYTHTHTHTHTLILQRTYKTIYLQTGAKTHIYMCMKRLIYAYMQMVRKMGHTKMHTEAYTHVKIDACTFGTIDESTHDKLQRKRHTHVNTFTNTQTRIHTFIGAHSKKRSKWKLNSHVTHIYTYVYIYIYINWILSSISAYENLMIQWKIWTVIRSLQIIIFREVNICVN